MRRQCLRIEDVIWDCAANRTGLPADARRHLDTCQSCARAFRDARQLCPALQIADRVPAAPDCRTGVMAQVTGAGARPRWSYAWAAAVVIVALVVLGVVRSIPRPSTPPVVVKKPAPVAPKVERRIVVNPPVVRRSPEPMPVVRAPKKAAVRPVRTALKRPRPIQRFVVKPREQSRPAPREVAALPIESSRPVSVVVVSWEPTAGDDSYGYVREDPETGVTTTCQVTRSGNNVNVRMESTPR
ncbi:MAG: hypothetical protein Q7T82_14445 [Armatimonadota bacterium]|nr:hypothetical protein [Armatimonadota bacterium]